ncbi:forkhead box protein N1 [Hippocampus zosterae]|uniref:forkhead box protein N1 n=1 Tax=Hippocampus zosterae TaxID=109293 RepID=UPI00223DE0A2|nr:forkhead box protein N1 [Hippocampus zosterae]
MSGSPMFSPNKDESKTSSPQRTLHTSQEHLATSCQQFAESQTTHCTDVRFTQQARTPLTSRHAPVSSKHSVEGMGRQGMVDACRFHPYQRQLSEGAVTNAVCLEAGSSPFRSLQEICSPQMCCITLGPNSEAQTLWERSTYNGQVATWPYATEAHSNKPNYSLQSLSSQIHQRNNSQPLFPKPIYSYSILIFMALKNSETGSLPVSEIYSFMTENFPYFKTAPDGWKNSVRHNLSLNKCFEKLESKNGTSSRKGCLWGLNPAKVEKMQEELHKWRRKDPLSVRRSMARPEDLDHLIGQMPEKLQSTAPYAKHAGVSRQPPSRASRHPQYSRAPPASQQSSFLSFTDIHFSDSMTLHSPCDEQHTADVHPGSVNLRLPPAYSATYQDDFNVGLRSLQDLQLEGDTYDVDVLNPSLTDLQLKGNLWEELQKDSLVSHLQTTSTTVSITSGMQTSCVHPGCGDSILPVSETSAVAPFDGCKIEFDDTSSEPSMKRDCSSRWHPDVYSADNLPGYLTCCTTSLV